METLWPQTSPARELSFNSIDVWAVRLGDGFADREYREALAADERQRADRFSIEAPRTRFIKTRAALRCLLGYQLNLAPPQVPLEVDANGKPRLSAGSASPRDLYFNVAHSGELALIALSSAGEVGVDIEHVRPVDQAEQIAKKYFHAKEMEVIAAARPEVRDATFLHFWTAKEAVLKAVGTGITGSLSHFCVPIDTSQGAWIELPAGRCWLQTLWPAEGYAAAIACVNAQPNIRCFELEPDFAQR